MSDILLLDNFDSFSFNLVDLLRGFNQKVYIYRNSNNLQTIILSLKKMYKPIIFLSPGPGAPNESGCLIKLIELCLGKIPIIGVCLGYQAIVQVYGGKIIQAKNIIHGKSSLITHDKKYMFINLPNPLLVARYHSLVCKNIPNDLIVNASFQGTAMAIRNNIHRTCGFQFHPESILTLHGSDIIYKTLQWARQ